MSKIIIVEDNYKFSKAMRETLEKAGHEVVIIDDLSSLDLCADKIKFSGADVVLLDHTLGADFTGEEIFWKIKSMDAKIVSTTAGRKLNYCRRHYGGKAALCGDDREKATNDLLASIYTRK